MGCGVGWGGVGWGGVGWGGVGWGGVVFGVYCNRVVRLGMKCVPTQVCELIVSM